MKGERAACFCGARGGGGRCGGGRGGAAAEARQGHSDRKKSFVKFGNSARQQKNNVKKQKAFCNLGRVSQLVVAI
jgi:hypothetical protein